MSGIEGNNQRGKGDDLKDGSEVKSASCIDATDTPRWNGVNCGAKTVAEITDKFSNMPYLFFVLLDTTIKGGDILRCRVWSVRPNDDANFMNILLAWTRDNDEKVARGEKSKTNLQLHPPRWEKAVDNITTNNMGNLRLPLVYHSEQLNIPGILVMETKMFNISVIKKGISERIER